jgi:adenosylmethionine-8-amino-7-oxononanoate aminotransferase
VAVASVIEDDNLLENVQRMGARLRERLATAFGDHPHVGDIRGRGLFVGIELVVDRAAKTPPAAVLALPARLRNEAMAQGFICYPGGGTADGSNGAHILLAPPFIYSEANVDELVTRLGRVLHPLVLD